MESQRILIVDDDPACIEAIDAALCPPHEVLGVRSSAAALSLLRTRRVNLVILDLVLGQEDGLELLPRLRAMTAAPVLVITAFGTRENLVRTVRAKPDDYMEKPFGLAEIRSRVATLLRGATPPADPLERGRTIIEREYDRPLTVTGLARRVGVSPGRLQRDFRRRFGVTPAAYLATCRMRQAASQLCGTLHLVKEIAAGVGFANANNFATAFKRHHGVSPRMFRTRAHQGGVSPHNPPAS